MYVCCPRLESTVENAEDSLLEISSAKQEQKINFNEGINAYERAVSLVVCDDVSGVL